MVCRSRILASPGSWWERQTPELHLVLQFCWTRMNIFFKDFIFLFLERGEEREKERRRNISVWEKHQFLRNIILHVSLLSLTYHQPGTWPATQAHVLTGNWTGDLSVCGMTSKPLSHISQGRISILTLGNLRILQWGPKSRVSKFSHLLGPRRT